jgi:hypothetical protein
MTRPQATNISQYVFKVCLNSKFPPTLHSTLEIQPATLFGEKCVRFVEGQIVKILE